MRWAKQHTSSNHHGRRAPARTPMEKSELALRHAAAWLTLEQGSSTHVGETGANSRLAGAPGAGGLDPEASSGMASSHQHSSAEDGQCRARATPGSATVGLWVGWAIKRPGGRFLMRALGLGVSRASRCGAGGSVSNSVTAVTGGVGPGAPSRPPSGRALPRHDESGSPVAAVSRCAPAAASGFTSASLALLRRRNRKHVAPGWSRPRGPIRERERTRAPCRRFSPNTPGVKSADHVVRAPAE